ncbi:MAG: AI-2E family transporter [Deltaproteobacteria bacterium]|jgi:predicted PurR-regulated permease PerM|nr:AI-2E family transporter [Deltaproteobacteria bacterium]
MTEDKRSDALVPEGQDGSPSQVEGRLSGDASALTGEASLSAGGAAGDGRSILRQDFGEYEDCPTTPLRLTFFLGLGTIVLLAVILIHLKFMLLPLVLAFFISSLLNPLVIIFRRWHMPRALAVLATLAVGLAVLWLAFNYFVSSLTNLFQGLPAYYDRIEQVVNSLLLKFGDKFSFVTPELLISQLSKISFGDLFGSFFSSFINLTGYVFLTVLFLLYFLPALPAFPDKLRRAFPGATGESLADGVTRISDQVQRFILYKTLMCAALGILVTIVCSLFQVDFARSWGVLAFLFCYVPKIGIPFAVLPPVMVCAVQYDLSRGVWLMLSILSLEAVFGYFLEPRYLGRSINLSPTATFLAILGWGWAWGAVGMVIAVPLMAVVKFTCDHYRSLKPFGSLMGN